MEASFAAYLAAGLGAGFVTLGAGLGIGKLAAAAMEGTARQPEAANDIRNTMLLPAVLIEGVAIIGQIVCILLVFLK